MSKIHSSALYIEFFGHSTTKIENRSTLIGWIFKPRFYVQLKSKNLNWGKPCNGLSSATQTIYYQKLCICVCILSWPLPTAKQWRSKRKRYLQHLEQVGQSSETKLLGSRRSVLCQETNFPVHTTINWRAVIFSPNRSHCSHVNSHIQRSKETDISMDTKAKESGWLYGFLLSGPDSSSTPYLTKVTIFIAYLSLYSTRRVNTFV